MATILITRHYSGFTNVADTLQVGNFEFEENAAATEYTLPEGYRVKDGDLYDCDGILCALYLERGAVIANSMIGTREVRLAEVQ